MRRAGALAAALLVGCAHREELREHVDARQVVQLEALRSSSADRERVRNTVETVRAGPTVITETWEEPAPQSDGGTALVAHRRVTRSGPIETERKAETRVDERQAARAEEHVAGQLEQHVDLEKKSETTAGPSWRWVALFLAVVAAAAVLIWRLRPAWLRFFGL